MEDKATATSKSTEKDQAARKLRTSCFDGDRRILDEGHKVMRAYNASVDAYNQDNWDASVVLSGKVLENIARSELSFHDQSGSLPQLVEKLIKAINSNQPLIDLASALKDGNGLAAHFDLEKESDKEIAEITLDLIECFISYLYIFRLRLHQLKELVGKDGEDQTVRLEDPVRAQGGRKVEAAEAEEVLADPAVVPSYEEVPMDPTPPTVPVPAPTANTPRVTVAPRVQPQAPRPAPSEGWAQPQSDQPAEFQP